MVESNSASVNYRDVVGFPGYRVGDDGSVWVAWRTCRAGRRLTDRWKPMKPGTNQKGYLYINLTPPYGGKYKTIRVHRLVLEAFIGPCPPGMECRHLNGVKADCRLANLAWGTPEQNRQDNHDLDAYRHGSSHSQTMLTEDAVRAIRTRYANGVLQRELAAELGISVPTISAIVNRKTWKHVH